MLVFRHYASSSLKKLSRPNAFVFVEGKLCVAKASVPLDVYEIVTAPSSGVVTSLKADVDVLPENAQQNHSLPYRFIECKKMC